MDDHAADRDRDVWFAGPVLVRAAMNGGPSEHGEAGAGECARIPDRAIDHEPGGAAVLGNLSNDFADQRPACIATAVDHENVPRRKQLERLVDRAIVACRSPDREGRARHRPAAVKRTESDRSREALKIVADDGCRCRLEARGQVRRLVAFACHAFLRSLYDAGKYTKKTFRQAFDPISQEISL